MEGRTYAENLRSGVFMQKFGKYDVVGAGINFARQEVFFT
jgi:hypothetical protein